MIKVLFFGPVAERIGSNTLQAILRQPVQGDPKTTENSYEYLLRFAVH